MSDSVDHFTSIKKKNKKEEMKEEIIFLLKCHCQVLRMMKVILIRG